MKSMYKLARTYTFRAIADMHYAGDEFKNDPRNPLAKSGGAH